MSDIPNYKGVVSKGVKFIKISRLDANNVDRSAYLEQLQSFRLVFSDTGPIQYNVISTQELANDYVFGVQPQPLTSSYAFGTVDNLTVFTPEYLNFEYNDYNALLGNADIPQSSNQYLDVDYATGMITPQNFELILSGTADFAQVQDSNYSSAAWSNIRYNGSRYNSYRLPSTKTQFVNEDLTGNFNDPSIDNSGYGKLPAAEQNQTYMVYFEGVGGTGPELIDHTAYIVKYLIDTEGNITDPSLTVNPVDPSSVPLYNLLDNFEPGKRAIVRLINTDPLETSNPNDNALTGIHPISFVGRISPILITETGSGNLDYITTMSFNYIDGTPIANAVANLTAKYQYNSMVYISNTDWYTMNYQNDLYSTYWSNPGGGDYRLDYSGGTIAAGTRIRLRVSFFVRKAGQSTNTFVFRILKNGQPFFNSQVWSVDNTNGWYAWAHTDWFDANQNDYFTVQYKVGTGGTGFQIRIIGTSGDAADTTFSVEQDTPTTTGFINGLTGVTASYWSVGEYLTGSNVTVLTSSQYLANIYLSNNAIQATPPSSSFFGFSEIDTPFYPIQVGDRIRFHYDENRLHCITKVDVGLQSDNTNPALFLTVTPPIATSSILNHFELYRIKNDGSWIGLKVPKPASGNSFTGIIMPEFTSYELQNNYDKIIANLTQKNVIS